MAHLPSYLKLSRHGIYYFRVRVPTYLIPAIKRQEYKKSLRTRCINTAASRATLLKRHFDQTINKVRQMSKSLSPENFNEVALELFELEMEWFYNNPQLPSDYQNESHLTHLEQAQQDMIKRSALNEAPIPFSVFDADSMLSEMGINDVSDQTTRRRFEATLHSVMVYWQNNQELKLNGKLVELEESISKEHQKYQERAARVSSIPITNQKVDLEDVNTANFSVVANDYLSHLQKSKGKKAPSPSTIADYRTKLSIYTAILKDKPFHKVTKQDIVNCKKFTYNLPKNINKINWERTHKTLEGLICDEKHGYSLIECSGQLKPDTILF